MTWRFELPVGVQLLPGLRRLAGRPVSESKATHGCDVRGEPAIMQRYHEQARLVADGRPSY